MTTYPQAQKCHPSPRKVSPARVTHFHRVTLSGDTFSAKCHPSKCALTWALMVPGDTGDTFPEKLRARARGKTPGQGLSQAPKIPTEVTLSEKVSPVSPVPPDGRAPVDNFQAPFGGVR